MEWISANQTARHKLQPLYDGAKAPADVRRGVFHELANKAGAFGSDMWF